MSITESHDAEELQGRELAHGAGIHTGRLGTPRYDLTDGEIAALTEALYETNASFIEQLNAAGSRFGCIAVDGLDPLANIGRCLEQRVFDDEAGDHSVEFMDAEYGPYEDRSLFFLAIDPQQRSVVGAARGITGSVGFGPTTKTVHDLSLIHI